MNFTPKRVGEKEIFSVDFVHKLPVGITIVSAVWSVQVAYGVDPNPNAMVIGAATISGSVVTTFLAGGLPDVGYWPMCTATLSDGEILMLPNINDGLLVVRA